MMVHPVGLSLAFTYLCVNVPHSSGWNELLIASFSHRSIPLKDGVLLASELQRENAHSAGVGAIFDRYIDGGKELTGINHININYI